MFHICDYSRTALPRGPPISDDVPVFAYPIDDELELALLDITMAAELFAAVDRSRPHLRAWLAWVDDTLQILDTREFLRLSMAGWAEGRMVRCAIRWRGEICGSASLEGIRANDGLAEIGYWIAADRQGKGLVSRSVAALSDLAFAELDLHRLVIRVVEGNTRSQAIPERLGWTFEGTARSEIELHGRRRDVRTYSMLREEWGG